MWIRMDKPKLVKLLEKDKHGHLKGLFKCSCGKEFITRSRVCGESFCKSCGCANVGVPKHGMCHTNEYRIYVSMKQRCSNPKNTRYSVYGARGIKVCDRWKESFENFYEDMGKRLSKSHSIDRINNDGDYCPENCRWATHKEQANNKSTNIILTWWGISKTQQEWADALDVGHHVIQSRYKRGWKVEDILFKPFDNKNKLYTFYNITLTIIEWAETMEVPVDRIYSRIKRGVDAEFAVFTPKFNRYNNI